MPQMSPMFWFNLYLMFILLMMMMMILIFYIYKPYFKNKNFLKYKYNLIW